MINPFCEITIFMDMWSASVVLMRDDNWLERKMVAIDLERDFGSSKWKVSAPDRGLLLISAWLSRSAQAGCREAAALFARLLPGTFLSRRQNCH